MSTAHRNHTRVIGLLAILALLVAVLAMTVSAAEADKEVRVEMTIGQTAYTVNGTEKTMDSAPYVNSDDRTMVPLRFLGEAIGAEVSWDAAADTAVIVYENQTIKFKLFENTMQVDDQIITIDTQSTIQNGRTMVPLRAAAEAIGSTVFYNKGVVTFVHAETVTVSNFQQLQQAVAAGVENIKVENFDASGETTTKVVIERPLVLDGNGAKIDFGFEVLSNGVTIKNFEITTSEFDKAVSAPGNNGGPGDCIVVEIHNDNTGKPVVVTGLTIRHDIFGNKNSAIYLADGSYVEIKNNNITVENKEKNSYERGGIFVGAGVSGEISGNTIDAALTGFPMSPIGLATTLDKLTEDVKVAPVVIKDNKVSSIYVTKMYASGTLFGEDGSILKDDKDFGVREALSKFLVDLEKNNTFTLKDGYPVENEAGYVQCRLDKIMAGAPYYEKNVFFNVTDGKLAAVPAPAEEK
ncbi:MAG: hypothetical protein HFG45_03360 [Oscillospiraceae bacterium]|jgi:hypothetical protein|nr:hypothetical protein [Oscillospiraceae bacterium]